MAVLIECFNVVVPVEVLNRKFPGGVNGYSARRPNATYVSDGLLTRVAFMAPRDVQLFTGALELLGLTFLDERGYAADFVVVDHLRGPTTPCEWLEFAEQPHLWAAAAWLRAGGDPTRVYVPAWWKPRPNGIEFVPEDESRGFHFVGVQTGVDTFEDKEGEKRYIGRPFADGRVPFADLRG